MRVFFKCFNWLLKTSELVFPIILCTFGFLIQSLMLIREFSKREITYDYKIEFNERISIPHVTICSRMSFIAKFDKLQVDKPHLFHKICPQGLNQECLRQRSVQNEFENIIMGNLDMDEITQYVPRGSQLIKKVEIGEYTENRIGKNCIIIDHLLYPENCYTIICRNGTGSFILWRGNFGLHLGQSMIKIHVNTSDLNGCYFRVMIHPSEEDPLVTPSTTGVRVISPKDSLSIHEINYRRTFLERLPYPYETNCKPVLVSKILDDCLHEQFISNFNFPSPIRFIAPEKYLGRHLNVSVKKGFSEETVKYEEIFSKCVENLPTECKSTNYDLQLYNSEYSDEKINQEMRLFVLTPANQDVTMLATPKMSCSNFIISFGAIIGSWFGFSVFNIAAHLIVTAKGFAKHHQQMKIRIFFKSTGEDRSVLKKKSRGSHPFVVTDDQISRFIHT